MLSNLKHQYLMEISIHILSSESQPVKSQDQGNHAKIVIRSQFRNRISQKVRIKRGRSRWTIVILINKKRRILTFDFMYVCDVIIKNRNCEKNSHVIKYKTIKLSVGWHCDQIYDLLEISQTKCHCNLSVVKGTIRKLSDYLKLYS